MEDWTCVAQENVLTGPREMGAVCVECVFVSVHETGQAQPVHSGFQCAE